MGVSHTGEGVKKYRHGHQAFIGDTLVFFFFFFFNIMLAKVCSKIFSILRCKISNIAFDFRIIKTKKWARQSKEKHPKIGPFKRVKIPKTRELPGALPHGPHQGPLSAPWTPRRYNALFATLATLY